ncbi:MAG TPA: lysylphosphatidylglycerol synthase transmembrane domain-containing protein [Gaiellales bacterium]|nr:lysylphosphatidylglycerol synthase transmembrane domain-containing protein [Gaiellales bacterium]
MTQPRLTSTHKRVLGSAGAVIVVAVAFALLLPKIANYRSVLDVIGTLSLPWLIALVAVAILNVATFGPPWMAALPGLSYRQSMVLTQTSTALSSAVPGGDAVGIGVSYGMLRGWRFDTQAVTAAVVVTGLWNQLINVAIPITAVGLLALEGSDDRRLRVLSLIAAGILAAVIIGLVLVLRSEEQARRVGQRTGRLLTSLARPLRRGPYTSLDESFARFRNETVALLAHRWWVITLAQLAGHLTVFLVLLVSLRAVGVDASQVSLVEALAAWSLIRLLTAIPITPGGLGIVEVGLSAALVGFGGPNDACVAAVLLYRALTFVPPVLLGMLLGLTWRRHANA